LNFFVKFKKSIGQQKTIPGHVFTVWSPKAVKSDKEIQIYYELKTLKVFVFKRHKFEIAETKASPFKFSLVFHESALELRLSVTSQECIIDKRKPIPRA